MCLKMRTPCRNPLMKLKKLLKNLSRERGLSDSFYTKSNTSCEPSYWCHAEFSSGNVATSSYFSTASRDAHASFSSKLSSIRLILCTFFVPPPATHQFLSNTAFPQQPPNVSVYPPPAATAAATGIKYSIPQFKVGGNTRNPTHMGMQPAYAQFISLPAGYSPSTASTTGGSAVWVPALGREISGMQVCSFYNLSPQGQHIAVATSQTGDPSFVGIYHPTQIMGGAIVYPLLQQSQTMSGDIEMV